VRYNRHVEETESTFHLSYQYYIDTWGVSSHMAELDWYQNFGDAIQIAPHVRYYSQTAADFYLPYLRLNQQPQPEMTSDYRLSAYGALSFGVKGEYAFHTPWFRDIEWRANLSVERYLSSGDLSLQGVSVPAPGLVATTPWSRNAAITLVAVAIATPHSRVICRVDGILSPGRSLPLAIRSRISATILW